MKLSEMSRDAFENCIDFGQYSDQDVFDLYEDLKERESKINELEDEIRLHRSNYDTDYWEEQEKEWKEDFPDEKR